MPATTTITHAKLVARGLRTWTRRPQTTRNGRRWEPLAPIFSTATDTGPLLNIPEEHVSD